MVLTDHEHMPVQMWNMDDLGDMHVGNVVFGCFIGQHVESRHIAVDPVV